MSMSDNYKIIVFDLDETLGYFQELSFFIDGLENILNIKISKEEFYNILDRYPEFLRPNILSILNLIKRKKQRNHHIKVMIYTNNQNPKQWVLDIKDYFNSKIKYNLFDKVIAAFKVNGEQIEFGRTTHEKTYSDFIKCTKLPKKTKICFIDDQHHPGMINDNVYYIKVKPYTYTINYEIMAERYYNYNYKNKYNAHIDETTFVNSVIKYMNSIRLPLYNKSSEELNIDTIVSKSIMYHLNIFLYENLNDKSQKNKYRNKKNKTIKLY